LVSKKIFEKDGSFVVDELVNRYEFTECLSRFEPEHTEGEFEQLITC